MESITSLDFLKLRSKDWDEEFERIATTLCNEYLICANERKFSIVDIEFYYYSETNHPDPFVYQASERNKKMGEWFFHYSGIDITLGEGESRGGILIRAIKDIHTDEYILGPLKSMYVLLNCIPSISTGNPFLLRLEHNPKSQSGKLGKEVRIGLDSDKKKKDPGRYQDKAYRFIAEFETIQLMIHSNLPKIPSQIRKNYHIK